MNDTDITTTIRATLHHHSHDAPNASDLLERVKAGSRRRTLVSRIGAGASALAVATVAALLAGGVLQPAATGGPDSRPDTDAVRVCVDTHDGEPRRLLVAATDAHDVVNVDEAGWRGGGSEPVEHPVDEGGYRVAIRVVDELRLVPIRAEGDKTVAIHDQPGRLGDETDHDDSGDRMLAFETGTRVLGVEAVLLLQVVEGEPTDAELITWAETLEFHAEAAPCEAGS